MPRFIEQLTALKVKRLSRPGYYADGGGLYLSISASQAKSWIYRYSKDGRRREMGLGSISRISLADARALAAGASSVLASGADPLDQREALREKRKSALKFKDCALRYIESHRRGWKNTKSAQQWTNTLTTYAFPVIGELTTDQINTEHLCKILEPIWLTKAETATRLRGRIESILDWAKTRGLREGENPARLKGHLDKLLPPSRKSKRVKHHPALPWDEAADFYKKLGKLEGDAPKGLKLVMLTALRCGNVASAEWSEIDLKRRIWTIPGVKMKAGEEFRLPISSEVAAILQSLAKLSNYVFPGREKRPMTIAAFSRVRDRLGREDITVHGFRTTFRNWASDYARCPRDISEMALAHAVENKTEASYARTDHLERRSELMEEWAAFLRGKK